MAKSIVIAIDGPAASGKGTLSRRLANWLEIPVLDTGRLYRAVGVKLVYDNIDPQDKEAAIEAAKKVRTNDLMDKHLRQENVGRAASIVSAYPEVREILLQFQRDFAAKEGGAILDGRDIGTVICPDADLKLFVTASDEARARRRYQELMGEGVEVNYQSVLQDLQERDKRDRERDAAPLAPAEDALVIDTSDMTAEEVFIKAKDLIGKIK